MKLPLALSMFRTFKVFLLIAGCVFVVLFGYFSMAPSPQLFQQQSLIYSKHAKYQESVSVLEGSVNNQSHHFSFIKHVISLEHETSVLDSDPSVNSGNSTLPGKENNRFKDIKTISNEVRTRNVNNLHEQEDEQNQALTVKTKPVDLKEKFGQSKDTFPHTTGDQYGKDQAPVLIVILARMRTGSSLMGEICNQNPSIFYLFEPLVSVDRFIRAGVVKMDQRRNLSSNILLEYSQCRFPKKPAGDWILWNAGLARNARIAPSCPTSKRTGFPDCTKLIGIQNLTDICREAHQRVCVKMIRADLDYLKPLVDAGINVKIIHAVRDPRGTANSRKDYYSVFKPKLPVRAGLSGNHSGGITERLPEWLQGVMSTKPQVKDQLVKLGLLGDYPDHVVHTIPRLCQWTRDSILQARKKPAWLRDRYKLVRYEDFALDPPRVTKELYDFVGIDLPRPVMDWIVSNTRKSGARNAKVKMFGTNKDSVHTAWRWRRALSPVQVRQVEEVCREAMELLGYKTIGTVEELRDFSSPLMHPLHIDDTI